MLDRQHRTGGASLDEQHPQVIGIAGEDGVTTVRGTYHHGRVDGVRRLRLAQSSPAARARAGATCSPGLISTPELGIELGRAPSLCIVSSSSSTSSRFLPVSVALRGPGMS